METASIPVELRQVSDLTPYARNARKHSPEAVERLASIIEELGWTGPILADGDGIVAGHKRRLAALSIYGQGGRIKLPNGDLLPAGAVPVIDCSGWSEGQRRAYILADNQTTLESEWDGDMLKLELSWLEGAGVDLGLTGFSGDALAKALGNSPDGYGAPDPLRITLADRFGVPPFSVLNAREGWWQDRKRAWLSLGIMSELGRGEEGLGRDNGAPGGGGGGAYAARGRHKPNAAPGGSPRPLDRMKNAKKANATPGGSKMPAANYGKSHQRGDGKGRPVNG